MAKMEMQVTEGLTVVVLPNERHEFLMTTKEVALGYGVSMENIRSHKGYNADEFIEGKHFIKGCDIFSTLQKGGVGISNDHCKSNDYNLKNQIFWTKRGIVRLGFFIKSERARLFRDWAEDLILMLDKQTDLFGEQVENKPLPGRRRHNRLTPERMVDILTDVCLIKESELRERIVKKLKMYGNRN